MIITSTGLKSNIERSQFKRQTRRLEQDVLRMGALVEHSFRLSHEALFSRKISVTKQISILDDQIDKFYHKIELECATLMTLQAPVASDLRMLSAYMHLVRDLERIGDYAEDLGEFAVKLFPYHPLQFMKEIEFMSQYAQGMLSTSLVALADLDAEAGLQVKKLDDQIDDDYERIYQKLASQKDVPGVIEPLLLLGLVIRHIERMADHATNIGQRVAYVVTGNR
ncbi:MAG TPA: phosphate signaling complex protein PhoU [Allocoleopsis sp.]